MLLRNFHFFLFLIKITLQLENQIIIYSIKKYSQNLDLKTPEEILKDLKDNSQLSINFEIGTPTQTIPIYLDFDKYPISLAGPQIKESNIIYNNTKSSSSKINTTNIQFNGEKFSKGYLSKDKISLINYDKKKNNNEGTKFEIDDLNFVLSSNQKGKESGTLGLSPQEIYVGNNLGEYNFINQLKLKKIIKSSIFTIKFTENKEEGELIIGDYPHKYDTKNYNENNYKYLYAMQRNGIIRWDITFDNIYSNNEIITKDVKSVFSIESGVIISFLDYKEFIDKQFFNEKINSNQCFTQKLGVIDYYYYYYCNKDVDLSKFPNLNFEIKSLGFNLTLSNKDLFKLINDKYIFLVLISGTSISYWVIGEPFFRKNQIVFNQEIKNIGFYLGESKKKNSIFDSKIFWIFMVIISIIIILYLIKIIYFNFIQKSKRQLANELIENYNILDK